VVTLAVYLSMVPAGVGTGDEAEAQTVPYILGILHPPGFPAFTLAGWLASHAVPVATVAWRLNVFNAVCTAAGAAGVVLLAMALGASVFAAAAAALVFAFGNSIWDGALHVNAQVFAATLGVYALWASVVFARSGSSRMLIGACALCGLGIAAHPAMIWISPAIVVAALCRRQSFSGKTAMLCGLAFVVPLLLYAYVPLRSQMIAERGLDPLAATPFHGAGTFDWSTGALEGAGQIAQRYTGPGESAVLHSLNPSRLPDAVSTWIALAQSQYRLAFLFLSTVGLIALAQRDRRSLAILIAGTLGGIAFAYTYRLDTHLDRYLFVSFAAAAALAAASTQLRFSRVPDVAVRAIATLALTVVAVIAGVDDHPIPVSRLAIPGEAIIAAVRHDTPANAIVVAQWNDAAALGYGTFVEHSLGARTIVAAWPNQFSDRYGTWAHTRPVVLFVSPLAAMRIYPMWADLRELDSTLPNYRVFEVVPSHPKRHAPH
jgi:Protein of unknown function (DUF2723)